MHKPSSEELLNAVIQLLPDFTVSKYVGHSDIKTTQIYMNPSQDDLNIAGEIIGTLFNDNLSQNCGQHPKKKLTEIILNT